MTLASIRLALRRPRIGRGLNKTGLSWWRGSRAQTERPLSVRRRDLHWATGNGSNAPIAAFCWPPDARQKSHRKRDFLPPPCPGEQAALAHRPSALTDPPQETQGQTDATPHDPSRCPQVSVTRGGRACLCPPEGADGPVHPHRPLASPVPEPKSVSPTSSAANGLAYLTDRTNLSVIGCAARPEIQARRDITPSPHAAEFSFLSSAFGGFQLIDIVRWRLGQGPRVLRGRIKQAPRRSRLFQRAGLSATA